MHMSTCTHCHSDIANDDNFCRRCGTAVVVPAVPATRTPASITIWRPQASPVVKGAAVMAAGTVGQFVFRRVLSSLINGASRKPGRRGLIRRNAGNDGMVDEAQIITETIMMRRVRIRRQA